MAKKQSTAKKPIKVSPPAKKLFEEVPSTSKKHPPPESPPSDYEEMESEEDLTHSSSEEEEEEEDEPDSGKNPQSHSAPAPIQNFDQDSEAECGESDSQIESVSTKPPLSLPAPVASPRTLRKRTIEVTASSPDSGKNPQSLCAPAPIQGSDQESQSETESGESDSEAEPVSTKPLLPPPAPVASPRTLRKRTVSPEAIATTTKHAKAEIKTGTGKKASSQRVWSEEDEVVLLQCFLEFKEETGKNPSEDVSGFYKLVKDGINFKGKSFSQFTSKVTKLKSKYLGKSKSRVIYTKPHDLKCLDLCKKIWVTDLVSSTKKKIVFEDNSVSVRVDGVNEDSDWFEKSYLAGAVLDLGVVGDEALKKKWSLVPVEIKKKLEEKSKLIQEEDFKRVMLKNELLHEVSSAMANA